MLVTEFSHEDYYYNQNMYGILLKYHCLVLLFQSTSHILSQASLQPLSMHKCQFQVHRGFWIAVVGQFQEFYS